ncbi:MAG: AsmA-like C-terminal domain-containing protein [Mariprofundaceae bacterium]|nr:AsmA-like C-terminal domain-containing protein [Mariprofundaceae bacterium]
MLCFVAFGAWVYWHAPPLDTMRPELESMLKQRLDLQELRLGHLSWRWAGYTWLQVDNTSFTGQGGQVRVSGANLAIRLSMWDMLAGRLRPISINVRQGIITLHIPEQTQIKKWVPPSSKLSIEDTTLILIYGTLTSRLEHLNLHMDGPNRSLSIQLPGSNLNLTWNEAHEPTYLRARFHDLDWLPTPWRMRLQGDFIGEITLQHNSAEQLWHLQTSLSSSKGAQIMQADGLPWIAFNAIETKVRLRAEDGISSVTRLEWEAFNWRSGANELRMAGEWQDDTLHMKIGSGTIQLPVLAKWLKLLGNAAWQQWLTGLRKGEIRKLGGEITVVQTRPWQMPEIRQWKQSRFHMHAQVHDAAIPLATPGEQLQHLQGIAEINERGMQLKVNNVVLPHEAGKVHGTMTIRDWQHIAFDINGNGNIDIARYQAWRSTGLLPQLVWRESLATARFSLRWPLHATAPSQGTVELMPDKTWQADLMGRHVHMSDGVLRWDAKGDLKLESMHIEHDAFTGTLSLNMQENRQHTWQLTKLSLQTTADFPKLVNQYRIPLDTPAGQVRARLTFDRSWHLNLDFHDTAWQHLLGANKTAGEPYFLTVSGEKTRDGIRITNIESRGTAPKIQGNGVLSSARLRLRLRTIQAPAFTGSISILVPFNDAPLEVNIRSEFLNRAALPNHIPTTIKLTDVSDTAKAWVLRGFFRQIKWDAVSIYGVHIQFASSQQGVGLLEAEKMNAAQLSVSDVRAFFRLPGNGVVDIRQLSAKLLGQALSLSATLSPEPGGGLRWRGFADVSGDFSEIIHRLDASRLFEGGTVHALWSGQGLLDPEHPWWNDMRGRLRLRSDNGRMLVKNSTMTKLLAALSLTDLPKFLTGKRKDVSGIGMFYKRLQLEAAVNGETAKINQFAIRASALDMAGSGKLSLANGDIDLYMTVRPLQNLDAFLRMIPLLRDLILGPAKSVFRKVYHVYGPLYNAKVESVSPEDAGLPESGFIEHLIHLPGKWFDSEEPLQQAK